MSSLSTIPKGDSAWLLRKSIQRIIQQVSVLETNIGSSTTGNSANQQIIFNDNGVLRGDADLLFNTSLNKLIVNNIEVSTTATITGDLTVDTSTLYVSSSADKVGIGTTSLSNEKLTVAGNISANAWLGRSNISAPAGDCSIFRSADNTLGFGIASTTAMTLNSTGLGVGGSPSFKLHVQENASNVIARFTGANVNGSAIDIISTGAGGGSYKIGSNFTIGGAGEFAIYDSTAGATRLLISSSGNVGIGVTPSAWGGGYKTIANLLYADYYSNNGGIIGISGNAYNNGTSWIYKNTTAAHRYEQSIGSGHIWYNAPSGTAGNAITFTQAMTLDASGNLLVGTTTNTDNFRTNIQFSGTSTNGLLVKNLASSGAPLLFQLIDSAQSLNNATPSAEYQDSTTQRWRLYKNGGLANYQANNVNLSDVRTKTDIKPLGSYWNKIKSLEVVTFKYKDQTHSDDNIGLIAQQVESVAPELVDADGFGNTPEDGVPLKTIYTTDLYHAAIKGLQEAMTRIEALESKLA